MAATPTALVTGCSSGGIGHALAAALAGAGVRVFATARSVDAMAGLAALGCTLIPLDVTDDASVATAVDAVDRATGGAGVDVVVNNAGATFKGTLMDCPPAACAALLDVNVVGVIRVTQAFAAPMCTRGRGVIVNVGSATGYVAQATKGVYSASKHAVRALTTALRIELAPFGVRVLLLAPGYVATPIDDRAAAGGRWHAPGAASPFRNYPGVVAATSSSIFKHGPGARGAMPVEEFAKGVAAAVLREWRAAEPPGGRAARSDPTVGPPTRRQVLASPRTWLPYCLGGPRRALRSAPFASVAYALGSYAPDWVADLILANAGGVWAKR